MREVSYLLIFAFKNFFLSFVNKNAAFPLSSVSGRRKKAFLVQIGLFFKGKQQIIVGKDGDSIYFVDIRTFLSNSLIIA